MKGHILSKAAVAGRRPAGSHLSASGRCRRLFSSASSMPTGWRFSDEAPDEVHALKDPGAALKASMEYLAAKV